MSRGLGGRWVRTPAGDCTSKSLRSELRPLGTFSLSPFGVRDSRGWQGRSVLGPTVGTSVPLQSHGRGGGRHSILAAPNVCLLPKFGRTAGSRRKLRRPGELALSLGAVKTRLPFSCDSTGGDCAAHRRPHPPLQSRMTRCCSFL